MARTTMATIPILKINVAVLIRDTITTNSPKGTIYKDIEESPSRTVVSVSYMDRSKKSIALKFEETIIREYAKLIKKSG